MSIQGRIARLVPVVAAALATALTATAAPVNYTIDFTTTAGTAPTSGSFAYDSASATFSGFHVAWDGFDFDLTDSANGPVTGGNAGCAGSGGATAFLLLSHQCGADRWSSTITSAGPFPAAIHWFVFEALPTPGIPPRTLAIYQTVNHSGNPRTTSGQGG